MKEKENIIPKVSASTSKKRKFDVINNSFSKYTCLQKFKLKQMDFEPSKLITFFSRELLRRHWSK